MDSLQLPIEGPNALVAAEELLALPGITGQYEAVGEDTKDGGTLAAIATIINIVGGGLGMAEQLRKWYQEGKARKIEKVVIIVGETRLILENATTAEIAKVLEPLARQNSAASQE